MKIVAMLRVRNEARWIERVIASVLPVCAEVMVLDDHSEDRTAGLCAGMGATVIPSPFGDLNESRDKNFLLRKVADLKPDWVISIDGDEELAAGSEELIRELTARPPGVREGYRFQVLYLWDSPDQIRTDGIYRKFRRPSMFRWRGNLAFRSTGNGGNFHCGNVPEGTEAVDCGVKILHYGYLDRTDRLRKYEWYNRQDPLNGVEDGYRHMVIGDLFAPDSQFRHGGPLRLEKLCTHLSAA